MYTVQQSAKRRAPTTYRFLHLTQELEVRSQRNVLYIFRSVFTVPSPNTVVSLKYVLRTPRKMIPKRKKTYKLIFSTTTTTTFQQIKSRIHTKSPLPLPFILLSTRTIRPKFVFITRVKTPSPPHLGRHPLHIGLEIYYGYYLLVPCCTPLNFQSHPYST